MPYWHSAPTVPVLIRAEISNASAEAPAMVGPFVCSSHTLVRELLTLCGSWLVLQCLLLYYMSVVRHLVAVRPEVSVTPIGQHHLHSAVVPAGVGRLADGAVRMPHLDSRRVGIAGGAGTSLALRQVQLEQLMILTLGHALGQLVAVGGAVETPAVLGIGTHPDRR